MKEQREKNKGNEEKIMPEAIKCEFKNTDHILSTNDLENLSTNYTPNC